MPRTPATPAPASPAVRGGRDAAVPGPAWAVVTLMLVALNLRPALTTFGPVLVEAVRDTGMGSATAGALTTVPVLCLGAFGLLAAGLSRRFGTERTICGSLLLLSAGLALRGLGTVPALFAGTVMAGAAIGVAGVVLPGLVKRDFPGRASLMTGVYTMALCMGAAVAAGLTVPLERAFGGSWSGALAFWALPALAAALVWLPAAIRGGRPAADPPRAARGLWRDPLAWQVTLFMGLQSSLAYIAFGWLAPILRDRGLDPVAAGALASVMMAFQIPAALVAPVLATRMRSQGAAIVLVMGLCVSGMLGCLFGPIGLAWLFAAALGLGLGGVFALALTCIVLRAPDALSAARLSGMAQSVGYALASLGPFLVGLLHGATGSWAPAGAVFAGSALLGTLFGLAAGRDRRLGEAGGADARHRGGAPP